MTFKNHEIHYTVSEGRFDARHKVIEYKGFDIDKDPNLINPIKQGKFEVSRVAGELCKRVVNRLKPSGWKVDEYSFVYDGGARFLPDDTVKYTVIVSVKYCK